MDDDLQGDGDGVTDDDLEKLHQRTKDWKKKNANWRQLNHCRDGLNGLTPQCNTPTTSPCSSYTQSPTLPLLPVCDVPPPTYHLERKLSVDWSKVDYIDAGIDVIGLGAEWASLIPAAAPIAVPFGTIVEGIGFIKSTVELIQGDPRSMLVSQTTNSAKVFVMAARLERMVPIPVLGTIGNLMSLTINLKPTISSEWVKE